MPKILSFENINEMNKENSSNTTFFMPKELAEGQISLVPVCKGLFFYKFDIDVKEDFIIENKFEDTLVSFSAFLNGSIQYKNVDFKINKTFKPNHLSVSALNQENGKSFYKKDSNLKIINMVATKEFIENQIISKENNPLNKTLQDLENKPLFKILKDSPCSFETLLSLNTIFNSSHNNKLENLLLQSHTYGLLYNWLNNIQEEKEFLPSIERHYLNKLMVYIDENLFKDLTLKELAKVASTNETKLQKIFKIEYNTTVFKYIINKRLEKAKKLLETNEYSINEVSELVGYKHQSNFTFAFFKKFNISPKEVLKNKKFYF
ncbi:hypothetical protein CP965_11705 [Halarcobacter mediterraneus]|uniref:HTH araC/xylS-type domain-containing protein n=1 Tax=Halarcobacter mediterraneus TaxID=2023153 RepID=A0A4Q1AT54_9BACT|nr:AraC family transcriptional regulator [Halarcobacter mediterraneus]RXK11840.1 hypothetical protein CP965_11705 [Halarcobacter mediterraneus]